MQNASDLNVVTRTYDLTLWLMPHTAKFSRAHRYTLGTRIEDTALDLLCLLVEAGYSRDKRELLRRANLHLEKLRFLNRLSRDLKLLSVSQYEYAARALEAIGAEVGGWARYLKSREGAAAGAPRTAPAAG